MDVFLKTFLGGKLLSAMGRDGNDQMYSVTWAIVEGENNLSWEWFFLQLQKCMALGEGVGVTLISDEHQPILNVVSTILPSTEHRHCARHIYMLWHKSFRGDDMKLRFWKIVKAYNLVDYQDALDELGAVDQDAVVAFNSYNPRLFCREFMSTSTKTDVVTNNLAETFNGYIINARTKHLLYMLEDIRASLMQRLVLKRRDGEDNWSTLSKDSAKIGERERKSIQL
ncbi:uncharacterized protein LOC110682980 [Chenopodium quinoa]|uniref:uncharacterized protein LOC110682980 n=1 Tax=Chenopodium quinoa TaxID=63459 RepID=UPI000B78F778|nr:uncharacterized protein LOC110682980 [Chenopodium quinoa]